MPIGQGKADAGRRPARIGIQHGDNDGHIRPTNRNNYQEPDDERQNRDEQENFRRHMRLGGAGDQINMPATIASAIIKLMAWRCGNKIGAPDIVPCNLAKAMTDPEKCDGTNGHAQRHFNQACSFDDAIFAYIKGFGRQKRGPGDHDRCQSDKRVEGGNKLGHIRHGNAAGNRCTNDAANGNAATMVNQTSLP